MAKVLCTGNCLLQDSITAIVTTITRPRGNTEAIVSIKTITGAVEMQKKLAELVQDKTADKKVVVTVIIGQEVYTKVYDSSA